MRGFACTCRWRGRIIENEEVALIWRKALHDEAIDCVSRLQQQKVVIDWVNTYRANFRWANAVGDEGLRRQARGFVTPVRIIAV